MMDKRGSISSFFKSNWVWFLIFGVFAVLWIVGNGGIAASAIPDIGFSEAFAKEPVGFEKVFAGESGEVRSFKVFNYVFGKVPGYLVELTESFSAGILVIGIWFIFLLTFGDILGLFGMFTKQTSWLIALILTIILANVQFIKTIALIMLTLTAGLGSMSVVASILLVFGLFIAFHFGTGDIRRKIILRRAEDQALRAVAGGKKAASGLEVLKEIAGTSAQGEGQ